MSLALRTWKTLQISLLAVGLCKPLWASVNSPSAPRWNHQSIALASVGNVPPPTTDGTTPLTMQAIKSAAMQRVEAKLTREKAMLRQELLAADTKEISGLKAAITAAMKSGNVNAVLAAHHLLKAAQLQRQDDHTAPPFVGPSPANQTAGAAFPPLRSIVVARTQVTQRAAKAWATAWAQAQVAYPQLVIKAIQRQIISIKAALKADMAAGNVHAVIRAAKTLKLAQAEIGRQRQAIRNAKAQPAIATGIGGSLPGSAAYHIEWPGRPAIATSSSSSLAPFGVSGGGVGTVPQFSYVGQGGNATRIVYILDYEGSTLENFQFLKSHLRKSIDGLVPLQSFAVIVFRKNYKILGPNRLVHATLRNKQDFFKRFRTVTPAGAAEYRYRYFARPFKAAFRLHPQIIYFLTKGAFDPKLISYIRHLNKNHAVHIYTYAFTLQDPVSRANLKKIARENGGEYKYISRQKAGQ